MHAPDPRASPAPRHMNPSKITFARVCTWLWICWTLSLLIVVMAIRTNGDIIANRPVDTGSVFWFSLGWACVLALVPAFVSAGGVMALMSLKNAIRRRAEAGASRRPGA